MAQAFITLQDHALFMYSIRLKWPPTANTYWRRYKDRYFICKKGKEYIQHVKQRSMFSKTPFSETDRLAIIIVANPPDKRRRDLDNICKCLFDSLQKANIIYDDAQIDEIYIKRSYQEKDLVDVTITKINPTH